MHFLISSALVVHFLCKWSQCSDYSADSNDGRVQGVQQPNAEVVIQADQAYARSVESLAFTNPKPPQMMQLAPHQPLTLRCEAAVVNGPQPTVYWMRDGDIVSAVTEPANPRASLTNPTAVSALVSSALSFPCVQHDTSGDYVCVAETLTSRIQTITTIVVDTGRSSRTKQVNVEEKCPDTTGIPRIVTSTKRYIQTVQRDAVLMCRSTGSPAPKIAWFYQATLHRKGNPASAKIIRPTQEKYEVLETGDLLIRNISAKTDRGYYICGASNIYGSHYTVSFLQPVGNRHQNT